MEGLTAASKEIHLNCEFDCGGGTDQTNMFVTSENIVWVGLEIFH